MSQYLSIDITWLLMFSIFAHPRLRISWSEIQKRMCRNWCRSCTQNKWKKNRYRRCHTVGHWMSGSSSNLWVHLCRRVRGAILRVLKVWIIIRSDQFQQVGRGWEKIAKPNQPRKYKSLDARRRISMTNLNTSDIIHFWFWAFALLRCG